MRHVIRLGYDGELSVGRYAEIVRHAKENPAARFKRSFMGFWPVGSPEILRQFRLGVNDRINAHLPPSPREWSHEKVERHANRHGLRSECRWCGSRLPKWSAFRELHFCDADCRHSYRS